MHVTGCQEVYSVSTEVNIDKVLKYFRSWKEYTSDTEKLPTQECLWDLENSLCGLKELTKVSLHTIKPANINSDLIELHFSQVRHLFCNATPNVLQYQSIQNSIILGQPYTFANKKSNCGIAYPKPMNMYK